MKIKIKRKKISFSALSVGLFLFVLCVHASLAKEVGPGLACDPKADTCVDGYACISKAGIATSYCTATASGVASKKEDGLNCTDASECLPNHYCVTPSGNSVQKVCASTSAPITATPSRTSFDYTLLGQFPGFSTTNLPDLILGIYKFGIWTIGIAALFMMTVGGIMYMGSAGNTATANSAKDIIWDSIIGVIAAFGAYLLLYVINPDLTKISLDSLISANVEEFVSPIASTSSGNCNMITSPNNPCSVANLKAFATRQNDPKIDPDKWAAQASGICNAESGGDLLVGSSGRCSGTPIAYGLFQINLNTKGRVPGAFDAVWSSKRADKSGNDPSCKANTSILNPEIYKITQADANIKRAWQMYVDGQGKGYSWVDWEANSKWCHFAANSANK